FVPARCQDPSTVRTEHRVVDHIPIGKGGDDGRQHLFMMNDQFMEESFRRDLICRVELDRTRQKSDCFLPLSQLELPLGFVVACPARLPQLLLQFRSKLRFRLKRLSCVLTLALGSEPLKPGDNCENCDRCHYRITNSRLCLLSPPSLSNARIDI